MAVNFEPLYNAICGWARSQGIQVGNERLQLNKAGEFNGVSATMNNAYSLEERTYYLVHALGSIVRWSVSRSRVQDLFNELRNAKQGRDSDSARLERAIEQYEAFEIESSQFAVWLLAELGYPEVIPGYTNFMRADLEALTQFHRTGKAPVWHDFFAKWNEQVANSRRFVPPFEPKAIPPFQPQRIELQEILQEQG